MRKVLRKTYLQLWLCGVILCCLSLSLTSCHDDNKDDGGITLNGKNYDFKINNRP